jgi:hypothetical protein
MKEAATSRSDFDSSSKQIVRLVTRVCVYFFIWLLAAIAFQIFLHPQGTTETDLTLLEQRLAWAISTPLMVVIGLSQAVMWPHQFTDGLFGVVVTGMLLHILVTFTSSRRLLFIGLTCIQILFLVTAVVYFFRYSNLPTGG